MYFPFFKGIFGVFLPLFQYLNDFSRVFVSVFFRLALKFDIIGFGSFRKNGYYCLGFFANVQRFETSPTLPLHAPFFDAFRSFVASPLSYSGAPT